MVSLIWHAALARSSCAGFGQKILLCSILATLATQVTKLSKTEWWSAQQDWNFIHDVRQFVCLSVDVINNSSSQDTNRFLINHLSSKAGIRFPRNNTGLATHRSDVQGTLLDQTDYTIIWCNKNNMAPGNSVCYILLIRLILTSIIKIIFSLKVFFFINTSLTAMGALAHYHSC